MFCASAPYCTHLPCCTTGIRNPSVNEPMCCIVFLQLCLWLGAWILRCFCSFPPNFPPLGSLGCPRLAHLGDRASERRPCDTKLRRRKPKHLPNGTHGELLRLEAMSTRQLAGRTPGFTNVSGTSGPDNSDHVGPHVLGYWTFMDTSDTRPWAWMPHEK